jgi:hypothetical protein
MKLAELLLVAIDKLSIVPRYVLEGLGGAGVVVRHVSNNVRQQLRFDVRQRHFKVSAIS